MKILIYVTLLVAIITGGCNKTYDLDGASLGQHKGDFITLLYNKADITSEYDNTIVMTGDIPLFGTIWRKGHFTFKDDKLVELSVQRPFSTTPDSDIDAIKRIMRERCGGAYTHPDKGMVLYGSDEEKDCQGAIMINTDDDILFATIKIIK